MSYRRALLTRWSRRDRFAVLIVAVAVAFLTGTTLVVVAVGSSTASIAAESAVGASATSYQSLGDAEAAADSDAVVIPVSAVETDAGRAIVLGVPPDATVASRSLRPAGTTLGTLERSQQRQFVGPAGTVTRSVEPRSTGVFPDGWYLTDPATVHQLGVTDALVITPADGVPDAGVPLVSVLAFFLAGTRQALATLAVAAAVGTTLVGVTVYSVSRMSIRDRHRELYVLRATGTSRGRVRRLFLLWGTLLVGVGVAAGYALGVIATNLAVNAAVASGVPTSLATRVSGEVVRFLVPIYAGVLAVGWVATLVAIQPAISVDPADIGDGENWLDGWLPRFGASGRRSLLSLRTAVPTTATLAAFVTFLLVVAGLAGAVGPLAATEDATIDEPGSTHPIASQVPAAYAEPLRDRGITASPEILLFGVHDGRPYFARGAEYDSFARLSNATLVAGRAPANQREAVIGSDLAATLDVDVGETLLVGGSVRRAVTRVTVVGTFDGPGATDDQLIVSLPTARHLTRVGDGRVNFIRAERLPADEGGTSPVAISRLDVPATVAVGSEFSARVTVRNDGLQRRTITRTVRFGTSKQRVTLTVPANAERSARATFTPNETGTYHLRVGAQRQTVRVLAPDALRIRGLPDRGPVGSQPLLRVVDASGVPVENATVTARDWTGRTDSQGYVRVPLDAAGAVEVSAAADGERTSTTVQVGESASRRLQPTLELSPSQPSLTDRPRLEVRLSNPWNRSLSRTLTVAGAGGNVERDVSVGPGETVQFAITLPRRQPGTYDISVRSETGTLATTSYEVTGDERIVAALATGGRSGTTGIGQAAAVALGNLELALGILLLLGGVMTIGGTGAAFAGAVHANRRTIAIHRAVGATRLQIARIVLRDSLHVGGVAVAAALVLGGLAFELLGRVGLLTVYGVRMEVDLSWSLVGGVVLGSLLVVLLGAGLATATVLSPEPAHLLRDGRRR